jgi:phage host-nuclease inhibitor protein Gam
MASKTKTKAPPKMPQSLDEADRWLDELSEHKLALTLLNDQLQRDTIALNSAFETEAKPFKEKHAELLLGLANFFAARRDELTEGRTKTIKRPSADISWRTRPPSVQVKKVNDVIEAIRQVIADLEHARATLRRGPGLDQERAELDEKITGLKSFLREKVELNKQAMLDKPDLAKKVPGVEVGSTGEDLVITFAGLDLEEVA